MNNNLMICLPCKLLLSLQLGLIALPATANENELPEKFVQGLDDNEKEMAIDLFKNRSESLAIIQKALDRVSSAIEKTSDPNANDLQTRDRLKQLVAEFTDDTIEPRSLLPWAFEPGQIGHLKGGWIGNSGTDSFKVMEIIDEDTMIVESSKNITLDIAGFGIFPKPVQFLVSKRSTDGITNDTVQRLDEVFKVEGTVEHPYYVGQRLFEIQPYGPIDDEALFLKINSELARQTRIRAVKELTDKFRIYRDRTRRFSIKAKIVPFADNIVKFVGIDGNEVSVPIEKLRRSDQDLIGTTFVSE